MSVVPSFVDEIEARLGSGRLCLEFANTAEWHASDMPQETLHNYGDLLAWTQRVGIVTEAEGEALAQRAASNPELAQSVYADAVELREAIYAIFVAMTAGNQPATADVEVLNHWVQAAYAGLHVAPAGERFVWKSAPGDSLAMILYPIARSAATLLTSEDVSRVGQCADDRGCGYLFFDTSRNRSRRWCDMKGCGNRAKVRRHIARRPKPEEQS